MEIPGYTIHDVIGEGGMAKVYLATQESLDRQVALKVMDPALNLSDRAFCDRFYKEGKIVARLNHPGIVTVFDIGCHAGLYYMAMEYCAAGNLRLRIRQGVGKEQAVQVLRQIASALGYAHSYGFLHRDVKPANILFKDDDIPVLSDFGIAKAMDSTTQLTAAGFALGTPEYMSPEQAGGERLQPTSDLYSLGVVFYEMLTGKKPFMGTDALSTAIMHMKEPPPALPSELSEFQRILDRLLAKKSDQRFEVAEQLVAELDSLTRAGSVAGRRTTRLMSAMAPTTPIEQGPPSGKASRLLLGATLAGLLASGVGIAWWSQRSSAPDSTARTPSSVVPAGNREPGIPKTPESAVSDRVSHLLEIARAHLAVGRLREPPGSNALEAYRLVLETDSENAEAKSALREIESLSR